LSAPADGSLVRWAQQGVLLLNTCLTVEEGRPASHARHGWEVLTDEIVKAVAIKGTPVVFMLWGAQAQAKPGLITASAANVGRAQAAHLVLSANHPSPLSALRPPKPFLGCGHFGLANAFLQQQGVSPVDWWAKVPP
jgi:uracil-DNA glycosylase